MTEDEARTKWCPMVRHVFEVDEGDAFNRISNITGGASYNLNCIASDCMMWEWRPITVGDEDFDTVEGYCGLSQQ